MNLKLQEFERLYLDKAKRKYSAALQSQKKKILDQKYPKVNWFKYTVKVVDVDKSHLRLNRTISFNLSSSQNIRMEDENRLKNLPINFADQDLLF